jgi:hypothetical protein
MCINNFSLIQSYTLTRGSGIPPGKLIRIKASHMTMLAGFGDAA